jgi:hypothetical protein
LTPKERKQGSQDTRCFAPLSSYKTLYEEHPQCPPWCLSLDRDLQGSVECSMCGKLNQLLYIDCCGAEMIYPQLSETHGNIKMLIQPPFVFPQEGPCEHCPGKRTARTALCLCAHARMCTHILECVFLQIYRDLHVRRHPWTWGEGTLNRPLVSSEGAEVESAGHTPHLPSLPLSHTALWRLSPQIVLLRPTGSCCCGLTRQTHFTSRQPGKSAKFKVRCLLNLHCFASF